MWIMTKKAIVRVVVEFDWEEVGSVGLSPTGELAIPPVSAGPGIYRFRVSVASGAEVYIGESQDLRHRMRNYANMHKGETNVRVRELLLRHLEEGRDVRLAIVSGAVFEVDGEPTPADLASKDARLLVENTGLTLARRDGERIHNL
jgi:hypothetical protein